MKMGNFKKRWAPREMQKLLQYMCVLGHISKMMIIKVRPINQINNKGILPPQIVLAETNIKIKKAGANLGETTSVKSVRTYSMCSPIFALQEGIKVNY